MHSDTNKHWLYQTKQFCAYSFGGRVGQLWDFLRKWLKKYNFAMSTFSLRKWSFIVHCNHLVSIDTSWNGLGEGGAMSRVGQEVVALSMIGECRWVLQCFPYRHWTSSPPLKAAAAAASPATSCTQPRFSRQVGIAARGDTRWGTFRVFFGFVYR